MKKLAVYISSILPFAFLIIVSCSNNSGGESSQLSEASKEISLQLLTTFPVNMSDPSSAEISAYEPKSKRLFVVNSVGNKLEILDFSKADKLTYIKSIDLTTYGKGVNSVSAKNGIVAAAVEHRQVDQNGSVVFFDSDGTFLNKVQVGVLPDMLTFSPDGKQLVIANEGQPNDEYTVDPEGSISIIRLNGNAKELSQKDVVTLDFRHYNDSLKTLKEKGVRIFGPGASVAQDLEPEYISISQDNTTAWVTLQENNAVAIVDLPSKKITQLKPLGKRNYKAGDGNTSFGQVKASCSLLGMHQPDGISSFTIDGKTYLITANEGDPRNYSGFKEIQKLGNSEYALDKDKFPNSLELKDKKNFGKLGVSSSTGDVDGDGDYDEIHCYGSRSFSIWDTEFNNIYDSGDDFEKIACKDGEFCKFNERYAKIEEGEKLDFRGPEPESVIAGKIGDKIYAFITLERYGGVMVYNVTDPSKAYFVDYANSNVKNQQIGESRPEGILFINSKDSPNGKNLVVVANEGTSTIDVYEVKVK